MIFCDTHCDTVYALTVRPGMPTDVTLERLEKAGVSLQTLALYVGETKLTADMSLNTFFTKGGATSAGIDLENDCAKSYRGYLNGENEIGKFVLDFSQELPFIPLLYRQGMICYSHSMHGDMQGYENNYFSNIEDWYFN